MTSAAPAVSPPASADARSLLEGTSAFFRHAFAVAIVDLQKLRRDPTEMFTRAVQPLLWLLIFGQVFSRTRAIPTGSLSYVSFMAPGVLAQSVLFAAIFYGIAVIWERDLGIVHKLLVAPASRAALVSGKAIAAGVRGWVQAIIVFVIALMIGVPVRLHPLPILGMGAAIFLGSALFATFSLTVACIVKTRERFMGVGQLLTMPLFFASNAIYPLSMMPRWLGSIAHANPLTYLVDALRTFMVVGATSTTGIPMDFAALAAGTVVLVLIAASLYPGLAR